VTDEDEELWPPFYPSRRPGRVPADRRDQQLHDRASRMRDHGRPAPGRGRALSREEIVRTAIAVADAEGPHSISMRRIARELNAGAMSLYWHVSSKEELLDLMLDAIHGELTETAITGDVRADLRAMALSQRAMLRRHNWVMPFMSGRPPMGPNSLRNIERALGIFAAAHVPGETTMTMLTSVITYVIGAVGREQQEERSQLDQDRAGDRLGLSPEEMHEVFWEFMQRIMESGRYPHFTEMIKTGVDPDALESQDDRFEFGLDCLLDGIVSRLGRSLAPGASSADT
jgi:AcrR family transcriptional regulator